MNNRFSIRRWICVTMLVGLTTLVSPVVAQTVLGGGSTLPWGLYQDEFNTNPPFPPGFAYFGVNGEAGKAAFLANDDANYTNNGTTVAYATSEYPLDQTNEVNAYLTTGLGRPGVNSHGRLVQIPAAATAIAINFKGGPAYLALTSDQLCEIFSGRIDNWYQLGMPAAPLHVVYRSDSNGATVWLTRYLASICNGSNSLFTFRTTADFKSIFLGQIPPNFIGRNGDAGVAVEMDGQENAFAYESPDPIYISNQKTARLVNPIDGISYDPLDAAAVQQALAPVALPTGITVVTNPLAGVSWANTQNPGNPANWVRTIGIPFSGYPIVGYTNLIVSQCYADAGTTQRIKDWLTQHYADDWLVRIHGLAPLSSAFKAKILGTFITGTMFGGQLAIGNAAYCGAIAGR